MDEMSGRSDWEKIDEIVGKVVHGLPTLQELRLGEYKTPFKSEPGGETADGWGTSLHWMEAVRERYGRRIKEEVRTLDSNNITKGRVGGGLASDPADKKLGGGTFKVSTPVWHIKVVNAAEMAVIPTMTTAIHPSPKTLGPP